MGLIKKFLRLLAEYFVFMVGLLFIFVIGVLYAFIRPEGLILNLIFLVIAVGWMIFLIKYFWDLLEKNKKNGEETPTKDILQNIPSQPPKTDI